jgi:hypothetical protein
MRDHRLGARSARLGLLPRHALGGKRCLNSPLPKSRID